MLRYDFLVVVVFGLKLALLVQSHGDMLFHMMCLVENKTNKLYEILRAILEM